MKREPLLSGRREISIPCEVCVCGARSGLARVSAETNVLSLGLF